MNIHQNRENRIVIELSAEDMTAYKISFDEMDCGNNKTKELLGDILLEAEQELGKDLSDFDRMIVDVMPEISGGCIILLTLRSKPVKPAARQSMGLLCELHAPSCLFSLAETLAPYRKKVLKSKLFLIDSSKYAALVEPLQASATELSCLLGEYGRVRTANTVSLAFLEEHAKLLSEDFISSLTS